MDNQWLQGLKKGDKVLVVERAEYMWSISEVSKVLKTQVVLKDCSTRFRREDGHRWGLRYSGTHLQPATPENLARLERDKAERERRRGALLMADTIVWRTLTTDQIERIVAIAKEGQEVGL